MTEKREVIRRLRLGHSIRQINKATGMHRTIIRKLNNLAFSQGWLKSTVKLPAEEVIQKILVHNDAGSEKNQHPLDSYRVKLEKWIGEGYSYVVIHSLLKEEINLSETTVRRYCKRHFPKAPKTVFIRPTIPGEVMEVDFGTLGNTYDSNEKRNRRTYVFSARLRHSKMAWREKVHSQDQSVFFRCHVHAFEYFGGVPERVVPDNLKAAVIKASFTDPIVNRVYHRLAEHYGFVIDPCPPYRPNLKGGVENDIKYIKRNFWPIYREKERQLGHEIPSGEGLQAALEFWSKNTAHVRNISGIGARPIDLFQEEERDTLRPLPASRWKEVHYTSAKVHETWRIQVNRAYYSVPYSLIGKTVQVFISDGQVEIYDNYNLVATHRKATRAWEPVLNEAHNPPNVREFLATTKVGLLWSAHKIGPYVEAAIRTILERKITDGLRPARAVLSLQKKYGPARLNTACERAIHFDNIEYGTIKRILHKQLDMKYHYDPMDSFGNYCFQFSRPLGYFDKEPEVITGGQG